MDKNNNLKSIYENKFRRLPGHLPAEDIQLKYINKYIPDNKNVKILDAGCGNGRFSLKLRDLGYQNIDAFDIIENSALKDKISYVRAKIENIPFTDTNFEFIFSNSVIYYASSLEEAISELYRILAGNGLVYFSAHTKYSIYTFIRIIKRWLGLKSVQHLKAAKFHSTRDYMRVCRECGFKILLVDRFSPKFKITFYAESAMNIIKQILNININTNEKTITKNRLLRKWRSVFGYHCIFIIQKKAE